MWATAAPIAQIEPERRRPSRLERLLWKLFGLPRPSPRARLIYLHTDHLDTPRLATDANQSVIWRWEGEAFGATPPEEDPDGDHRPTSIPLRFPGQYADAESGLYYNGNRYYDPETGRYMTSDPIGLRGGVNTYAYVENNPLRYIDPSGLFLGSALSKIVRRLLGRTPEEPAYGGKILDVGIGAAAGRAPNCTGGVDISTPRDLLRGFGGVEAIGLSTATTYGLYGAGAMVGSAGAAAFFPGLLALYGGTQVGSTFNNLYEQSRGNSLGSDIYDLVHHGRLFRNPTTPRCGCPN